MVAASKMDLRMKLLVYKAAKSGNLKKLKMCLRGTTPIQVKNLVNAKSRGSTPLIEAARNGNTKVVAHLISECEADTEQCGTVTFVDRTVEGATPLWYAAASGHMPVVKCLVQNKANINSTTLTNSTPLMAACYDGHLEIVKYLLESKADADIADRYGVTSLMIACYQGRREILKTLLEMGADVNKLSGEGETALHYFAEIGNVKMIELFLRYGARMQMDKSGMTPIMTASIAGHRNAVEYLISNTKISPEEQIQALELLGASFVDLDQDDTTAYRLWSRAIALRSSENCIPKPRRDPVEAYRMTVEAQTIAELEDIRGDSQSMAMQALLVRERILGQKHPMTFVYIRRRGDVFADAGDFERCIQLWMYAFDMEQNNLEPLSRQNLFNLSSFAQLFRFMQNDQVHGGMEAQKCTHLQILEVLKRAVNEIKRGACADISRRSQIASTRFSILDRNSTVPSAHEQSTMHDDSSSDRSPHGYAEFETFGQRLSEAMAIVLQLLALCDPVNRDTLNENEVLENARLLHSVKNVVDHKKRTMLHLSAGFDACPLDLNLVTTFPSSSVVETLLKCGYDPNAVDSNGNTPIHVAAAAAKQIGVGDERQDTVETLLEIIAALAKRNGHMDYRNYHGLTPKEILPKSLHSRVNFMKLESLQCLAARAIMVNELQFQGHMPKCLWNFIANH